MQNLPLPVAVLFSGQGTNLKTLAQAAANQQLNIAIRCAICNKPTAQGIQHALTHGLQTHIIDHRQYPDKPAFEQDLANALDAAQVELIILAGFMRILSAGFVQRFSGKMINLHPSLLPRHRGLDTHQRALAAGDREHGSSIHLVVPELDNGPVIAQYRMPIAPHDTPISLAQRLAPHEHRLLQAVIALFTQCAIQVKSRQVMFNGQALRQPLLLDQNISWPINN